jgi:hypothetical protein
MLEKNTATITVNVTITKTSKLLCQFLLGIQGNEESTRLLGGDN